MEHQTNAKLTTITRLEINQGRNIQNPKQQRLRNTKALNCWLKNRGASKWSSRKNSRKKLKDIKREAKRNPKKVPKSKVLDMCAELIISCIKKSYYTILRRHITLIENRSNSKRIILTRLQKNQDGMIENPKQYQLSKTKTIQS